MVSQMKAKTIFFVVLLFASHVMGQGIAPKKSDPPSWQTMRKWNSSNGKQSFEGRFVGEIDEYYVIMKKDGKLIKEKIINFSPKDFFFVKNRYFKALSSQDEVKVENNPIKQDEAKIEVDTAKQNRLSAVHNEDIVYIPDNGSSCYNKFVEVTFDNAPPTEGFFNIDGKATKYSIDSSNNDILEIEYDATIRQFLYTFKKEGEVSIKVSAGNNIIEKKILVQKIPLCVGDPSDKAIEELGFPDESRTIEVSVEWPKSGFVEGIYYDTDASKGIQYRTAKHLRFKSYPSLLIPVERGVVKGIVTYTPLRDRTTPFSGYFEGNLIPQK